MDICRAIIARAFSKRAPSVASVAKLARFDGAFFQFAPANNLPPAGEDALVTAVQRIKPMHQRGYTAPRGALYALRVVNEALGRQLPLTAPAVLGVSKTVRSRIRKQAPLTPYTLAGGIMLLTQNATMPFGLQAFASGIAFVTLSTFRWDGVQWIAEANKTNR